MVKRYGMSLMPSEIGSTHDELFERLVTETQRALFLHILALVPRIAEAEEVLQETNLAIWRHAAEFEPGSNFRAWAFKIAHHRILQHREKRHRDSLMFNSDLIDTMVQESAANADARESRSSALKFCMEKLRPTDRELLAAYYRKGARGNDVAERFGRPVGSIYKSLCRIRKSLMQCIERRMAAEERA